MFVGIQKWHGAYKWCLLSSDHFLEYKDFKVAGVCDGILFRSAFDVLLCRSPIQSQKGNDQLCCVPSAQDNNIISHAFELTRKPLDLRMAETSLCVDASLSIAPWYKMLLAVGISTIARQTSKACAVFIAS